MRLADVRDESGFSLSELLIASALIVLVLSIAYGLSFAVTESSKVSEARGTAARDTGQPLYYAEKYLMQALDIEQASPTRVQYRLDRDLSTSGTGERQVLEVTADNELLLTITPIDSALAATGPAHTSTLAEHVVNVAQGASMFEYFDSEEVAVTDMSYVPSKTRSIRVTLLVEQNGTEHTDSRLIMLRNRE